MGSITCILIGFVGLSKIRREAHILHLLSDSDEIVVRIIYVVHIPINANVLKIMHDRHTLHRV